MFVLLLERDVAGRFLSLTHDLNLDTLCSDVVEYQLSARHSLGVDPASKADLDISEVLASLERFISWEKLSQVCGDLEFVRVGVGSFALSQLLDFAGADLEVLLGRGQSQGNAYQSGSIDRTLGVS